MVHSLGLFNQLVWNVPSWSISVEFLVYLVFGLFCIGVPPGRRAPFAVLLAAIGVMVLARFAPQLQDSTYDFGFFRCLYGFFVGLLTSLAWRRFGPKPASGTVAELVMVGMLVTFFYTVSQVSFWGLLAPLMLAPIVYVFAGQSGLVSRAMAARPMVLLGHLSYSLYITHFLISRLMASGLQHLGFVSAAHGTNGSYPPLLMNPWLGDLVTIVYLALVFAAGWCMHTYVEMPGQAWFNAKAKGIARRHPAARAAADATF